VQVDLAQCFQYLRENRHQHKCHAKVKEIKRDSVHGSVWKAKSVKCKNHQYINTPIPIFHLRRICSKPEARTSSMIPVKQFSLFLKKKTPEM
jgi:hypothetical protein